MVDARRALAVAALTCALVVTGCTTDKPAVPTPSPSPVSPTPTETAQERQERLDYAAAEKAYRTFRAEYNRVLRAGGAKEPTKLMKATAGGPYLSELEQVIVAYRGLGDHQRGTDTVVYVRPGGYDPYELGINVCEDGTKVEIIDQRGRVAGVGEIRTANLNVRRVDGKWKVWSGTGSKVKACV